MSHAPAVVPAAHASTEAAIPQDAQPHAAALQTGAAPSLRATAAHALATGPHRSSDAVRAAIFRACEKDPSPFVRACCIDELAKLGYEDAKFLAYLDKAAADPSDDVKMSAKLAKLRRSAKK